MSLLLLIAAFLASQSAPARVPVTDDCGNDSSFVEYRDRLAKAVDNKDVAALRLLVAPNIGVDLGGSVGWAALVGAWNLDQASASALWAELEEILALGCGEEGGVRFIPWNFAGSGDFDEALPPYWAVEKGAALRIEPEDTAPVLIFLDHHILFEVDNNAPEGWLHARLTDGRRGYVRLHSVRNAIDFRAYFEKRNGHWLMTHFLAGD
jgi:hypothetical protein